MLIEAPHPVTFVPCSGANLRAPCLVLPDTYHVAGSDELLPGHFCRTANHPGHSHESTLFGKDLAMTFRHPLDNKCSSKSRPSYFPSLRFLASWFLLLVLACACSHIAQAADGPATLKSVSTSDQSLRWDPINWSGDLNAMQRHPSALFLFVQPMNTPSGDISASDENEFLPSVFPASGTSNTANTSSAIFKTERWRTNKAVLASSIFEAAWLTADGLTTAGMSRGASEGGSAWAYGRHPTPGRTAGMMAAEFVGVEASSYVLHKMKAPKWVYIAPMIVSGSVHASGAIPNMKSGQ
jgi:hypothetical protein